MKKATFLIGRSRNTQKEALKLNSCNTLRCFHDRS